MDKVWDFYTPAQILAVQGMQKGGKDYPFVNLRLAVANLVRIESNQGGLAQREKTLKNTITAKRKPTMPPPKKKTIPAPPVCEFPMGNPRCAVCD